MNALGLVDFLKMIGAKQVRRGSKWVRSSCPLSYWRHAGGKDRHPSFGATIEDEGRSRCHCYTCGASGTLVELLLEMRRLHTRDPAPVYMNLVAAMGEAIDEESQASGAPEVSDWGQKEISQAGLVHPFDETWLESFPLVGACPWAVEYLIYRDVSPEAAVGANLRGDPLRRRVCFPVRAWSGVLAGMHGRAVDGGDTLPYLSYACKGVRNPDVWLGEDLATLDDTLVLVEGPFDLLSVRRAYPNAVASLGSLNKGKLARVRDAVRFVTLFDADAAGQKMRLTVHSMASEHGISVIHLEPPLGCGDVGEATGEQVRDLLSFLPGV